MMKKKCQECGNTLKQYEKVMLKKICSVCAKDMTFEEWYVNILGKRLKQPIDLRAAK